MALVYGFCFDENSYIGSTFDLKVRKGSHESKCYNENSKKFNFKVYRIIRELNINFNDIEWFVLEKYPNITTKRELRIKEDIWFDRLKPNLNSQRPHRTLEEIKEYHKQWEINNKEQRKEYAKKPYFCIVCDKTMTLKNKSRHNKTEKHLNNC